MTDVMKVYPYRIDSFQERNREHPAVILYDCWITDEGHDATAFPIEHVRLRTVKNKPFINLEDMADYIGLAAVQMSDKATSYPSIQIQLFYNRPVRPDVVFYYPQGSMSRTSDLNPEEQKTLESLLLQSQISHKS